MNSELAAGLAGLAVLGFFNFGVPIMIGAVVIIILKNKKDK